MSIMGQDDLEAELRKLKEQVSDLEDANQSLSERLHDTETKYERELSTADEIIDGLLDTCAIDVILQTLREFQVHNYLTDDRNYTETEKNFFSALSKKAGKHEQFLESVRTPIDAVIKKYFVTISMFEAQKYLDWFQFCLNTLGAGITRISVKSPERNLKIQELLEFIKTTQRTVNTCSEAALIEPTQLSRNRANFRNKKIHLEILGEAQKIFVFFRNSNPRLDNIYCETVRNDLFSAAYAKPEMFFELKESIQKKQKNLVISVDNFFDSTESCAKFKKAVEFCETIQEALSLMSQPTMKKPITSVKL